MRRTILMLAVFAGFSSFAGSSQAQIPPNLNDPFYQYYAWFLPRQAAMASQPKATDSINAIAAARSESAIDRSGLYGGASPFGLDALDPSTPGSGRNRSAMSRPARTPSTLASTNTRGGGDSQHFGRVPGFHNYRSGRSGAAPQISTRRGGGGMPSMPGGGMGGFGGGFN